MSEVLVLEGSRLIGKRLAEAPLSDELDLTVVGILRGEKRYRIAPNPDEEIKEGDLLLVQGRVDDILRVKGEAGIEIKADFELSDTVLESEDTKVELFEAMIPRGSDFTGQNLKRLKFRQRYQLIVLAINRHGINLLSKMSKVKLRFGDVLLLQGRREHVEQLAADAQILLLEADFRSPGTAGEKTLGAGGLWCVPGAFDHSRGAAFGCGAQRRAGLIGESGGAAAGNLRNDRVAVDRVDRLHDEFWPGDGRNSC